MSANNVVCFVSHDDISEDGRPLEGGWHYSVVDSPSGGHMPGEKLVLDDDGSYRPAEADDMSHNARHSQRIVGFVFEDQPVEVTAEEQAQLLEVLKHIRGEA